MAWLCTGTSGMSDVHNHRADIDIATKLIKRTKNIFETKLGLIFQIQSTNFGINQVIFFYFGIFEVAEAI
jgi:hypothetical protein